MKEAGRSLHTYLKLLRAHGERIPLQACIELMEHCVRHNRMLQRANVELRNKHHQFFHLTERIWKMGNPRFYSTFLDETLNGILSNIAMATNIGSNQQHWERRVFARTQLLGRLQTESHWYG